MNKQKIRLKNKIFYIKDNSQYTKIPKRVYNIFTQKLELIFSIENQLEEKKEKLYRNTNNNEDYTDEDLYNSDFIHDKENIVLVENKLDEHIRRFQQNLYDLIYIKTHKDYRQKAIDTLISIDSRFSKFIGR